MCERREKMTSVSRVYHPLILLWFCACFTWAMKQDRHEYCVIGAGPSGLQMGFFLKRAGHEYVIFEQASRVGNFFVTYPRHRTLISINKRFTGKTNHEFNLRHDWNSLISDDPSLLFTKYSDQFFPHSDDYLRYLSDYHNKLGLNVQFNTTISNINKMVKKEDGWNVDIFTMQDQHGNTYECSHMIVATGIPEPVSPSFSGVNYTEDYKTVSIDPKDFEGQSVLILGRGNSAFETAHNIYGATNYIHMVARSRVRLSWSTHYVGDLRAINNALLDTYQLKSLDAVLEASISELSVAKVGNKLYLKPHGMEMDYDNFAMREPYDRIIRCLGFKFDSSLFNIDLGAKSYTHHNKYPDITFAYESEDVPGLFFAGTNTHGLDYKKSAGGFIHGFRYTARALHRHLEWRNHNNHWPSITLPITELTNTILRRINEASGNYQMFSILGDVFILHKNGTSFTHLEEFPLQMIHKLTDMSGHETGPLIVWSLEYGANFSGPGKDVFRQDRAVGEPLYAYESNFLHPVFYYYKVPPTEVQMRSKKRTQVLPRPDRIHHIIEDFLTSWDGPVSHILPLRRFIEACVDRDLRPFFDETCFEYALLYDNLPIACLQHNMQGMGLSAWSVPDPAAVLQQTL